MIDLNYKHVRLSININNQLYMMHLIKCMRLITRVYGIAQNLMGDTFDKQSG